MARFQGFSINIDDATAIGYATLRYTATEASGPPTPEEALTWAGGGVGEFLSYDSSSNQVRMFRTAGPLPVLGTVMTGSTSSTTYTVTKLWSHSLPQSAGSVPNFKTSTDQSILVIGQQIAVKGFGGVVKEIATIPEEDKITFTNNWTSGDVRDIVSFVAQDETSTYGWPKDPERNPMVAKALDEIDSQFTNGSWIPITPINGWIDDASDEPFYMKDALGFVHFKGAVDGGAKTLSAFFILPVGYRPEIDTYVIVPSWEGASVEMSLLSILATGHMKHAVTSDTTDASPDYVALSAIPPFLAA